MQVFTRDLADAKADVASGNTTLGDYALHDLVALDGSTAGGGRTLGVAGAAATHH